MKQIAWGEGYWSAAAQSERITACGGEEGSRWIGNGGTAMVQNRSAYIVVNSLAVESVLDSLFAVAVKLTRPVASYCC